MRRSVFLDRDGTINVDRGYVCKVKDFKFLPGAVRALKGLYDNDFDLFVVTNQSGIDRGFYTLEDMHIVHKHMREELSMCCIELKDIVYCPHNPSGKKCNCRKPKTGMLDFLIEKYDIDVLRSYLVGDKDGDVEAGKKVGVTTIRIGGPSSFADYHCSSLLEASEIILGGRKC
ncbi:MAG: HAD family hydrolase [archaeon]